MRVNLRRTLLMALAASLVTGLATSSAMAADQPNWENWLSGADGMLEAMREHEKTKRPILVYFYADWCGYCRQLEGGLLSEDYVEDYLKNVIAVRINPEKGRREAYISQQYGVRGFPALFVHSGKSDALSAIERMEIVDGRPRLMSAEGFVDEIRAAAAR